MKIEGMITAMVTPLTKEGKINEVATRKLVNHLVGKQVNGLFILGTNGEFHLLSESEKLAFAKIVVDEVAGSVPVYAGTGSNSTEEVISLTNKMAQIGIDAVSVITPYFISLTEAELYEHYRQIALNGKLPIMLYHIPKMTGNVLSRSLVAKLAKLPNIVGIKDSSGDLERIKAYIEETKEEDFAVLSGSDSLILEALKAGADGAIAATSNVLTKTDVAIYQFFQAGDLEKAQQMQDSIEAFRRILKFGTIPSVLKQSISLMGIDVGNPCKPTLPVVNEAHFEEIQQVIKAYHKFENE